MIIKIARIGGGAVLAIFITGLLIWRHHFHHYTPLDALKDLNAAAKIQHSTNKIQDFLALRYGPQSDPANRQKAIVDFFNAGHVEGLYLIVGNRTDPRARALIGDVARTIADYRRQMTPAEQASLGAYFNSDAGRSQVQEATGCFQSKDARFRSAAAPVVEELLKTLAATR